MSGLVVLGKLWGNLYGYLFPAIEEEIGELDEKHQEFVAICEACAPHEHMAGYRWCGDGCPPADRLPICKAFIAKAVWDFSTTRNLIDALKCRPLLRRLCGWETASAIPSESTFSRAFAAFAKDRLPERIHEAMIKKYHGDKLVGHINRDATAIHAREKGVAKRKAEDIPAQKTVEIVQLQVPPLVTIETIPPLENAQADQETMEVPDIKKTKGKPGRKRKTPKVQPEQPNQPKLQKQLERTLEENLDDLPRDCNWGTKRNSQGKGMTWRGYKLHVDTMDGDIPVSWILSSASMHDSQAAIPLAQMTAKRVTNLYDLADSAYDAPAIREMSTRLGHVAIIDHNQRRGEKREFAPAEKIRYKERSSSERLNSHLHDSHGGRHVRVRGSVKVMAHLSFGLLVIAAEQLFAMLC